MSISLNNVNSEVVRAHQRLDGINIKNVPTSLNKFTQFYLVKMSGDIGLLIGWKSEAARNYIETSEYFSEVYGAVMNPWVEYTTDGGAEAGNNINQRYGIQYQSVTGTSVLFSTLYFYNDRLTELRYSYNKSENTFTSCSFLIVGRLK